MVSKLMDFDSSVEQDRIVIRTHGALDYDIFPSINDRVIELAVQHQLQSVLVVHQPNGVATLDHASLKMIAKDCARMNDVLEGGKLAVVLPGALDMGIGHIWYSYTKGLLTFEAIYQRTEAEAVAWLEDNA